MEEFRHGSMKTGMGISGKRQRSLANPSISAAVNGQMAAKTTSHKARTRMKATTTKMTSRIFLTALMMKISRLHKEERMKIVFLFTVIFFLVFLYAAFETKSDEDREQDDMEQAEYCRKWNEQKKRR